MRWAEEPQNSGHGRRFTLRTRSLFIYIYAINIDAINVNFPVSLSETGFLSLATSVDYCVGLPRSELRRR